MKKKIASVVLALSLVFTGAAGASAAGSPVDANGVTATEGSAAGTVVNVSKDGTATVVNVGSPKKSSVSVDTVTVNGVNYKVTTINKGAFKKAKKVKTVKVGASITTIKKGAFNGAKKLKTVKIANKAAVIEKGAFKGLNTKKMTISVKCSKKELKAIQAKYKKAGFKGKVKRY